MSLDITAFPAAPIPMPVPPAFVLAHTSSICGDEYCDVMSYGINTPRWDGSVGVEPTMTMTFYTDAHCCGVARVGAFTEGAPPLGTTPDQWQQVFNQFVKESMRKYAAQRTKSIFMATIRCSAQHPSSIEDAIARTTQPIPLKGLLAYGFKPYQVWQNKNSNNWIISLHYTTSGII